MMTSRLRSVTWLAVLLLIGGGVYAYVRHEQAAKAQLPKFETVNVDRGPLVAKITATGTLSALVTVQVGSQVSGRLQEILVDFNAPVKKGEVIARIDQQLFKAAIEQAQANAAAAQGEPGARPGAGDASPIASTSASRAWPSRSWSRLRTPTPRRPKPMPIGRAVSRPKPRCSRRAPRCTRRRSTSTTRRSSRRSTAS